MLRWSWFSLLERCWFSLVFNSRGVNVSRVRWSEFISLERCWFGLFFNSRGVYVSRVTLHLSSWDDISRVRPYISRVICLRPSSEKPWPGYIWIPSCTALYCRRRSVGVENTKKIILTLFPQNWFNLVPSGSMTSLMSSGNSYTNMVLNLSTFSVSLIKHHNTQGVKTAQKLHFSLLLPNQK